MWGHRSKVTTGPGARISGVLAVLATKANMEDLRQCGGHRRARDWCYMLVGDVLAAISLLRSVNVLRKR